MSQKKILIVEDDLSILDGMKQLLESEGYAIECAANGDEGINKLLKMNPLPNLILLDIMMPVKDGIQFCKEQQTHSDVSHIPVIIMTADTRNEEKNSKAGAKVLIKKPLDIYAALDAIKEHCL